MSNNNAICYVGRLQGITLGHIRCITKAQHVLATSDGKYSAVIVLIVDGKNSSKDKQRNPLSAERRIKYLKTLDICNGIIFIICPNVSDGFAQVIKKGYTPKAVVGGAGDDENTPQTYKNLLDKYYPLDSEGNLVSHVAIPLEREKNSDIEKSISGTQMREYATIGDYDSFNKASPFNEKVTRIMYNELRKNMGVE